MQINKGQGLEHVPVCAELARRIPTTPKVRTAVLFHRIRLYQMLDWPKPTSGVYRGNIALTQLTRALV